MAFVCQEIKGLLTYLLTYLLSSGSFKIVRFQTALIHALAVSTASDFAGTFESVLMLTLSALCCCCRRCSDKCEMICFYAR